jgi:hypothetical protein
VISQSPGSTAAAEPLRFLRVKHPAAGNWKLVLNQTGSTGALVLAGASLEGSSVNLALTAVQQRSGKLLVSARLLQGPSALTGAAIVAVVRGTGKALAPLKLYDDGRHGDGAAHDGRYANSTPAVPKDTYLVVSKASRGGQTRITSTVSGAQ